jgi:hypothetical protein
MERLPEKKDFINSFLTILTVVNFWALIVFLYNFPGLIKQITIFDLLSVLSYVLISALFESLVITLILLILGTLLPAKLLRSDFSIRTAIFIFLTTLFIIPFHTFIPRFSNLIFDWKISAFIAGWILIYIIELILFHLVIPKYPNLTSKLRNFIDNITVLGTIYLFLDLVAMVVLILNNWS